MSISKQEQIEIIIHHKNQIVKLTNNILQIVNDSSLSRIDEQKLLLKQYLNETISELSIIAGFCGIKEREWINRITNSIFRLNPILEWCLPPLIEIYNYCIYHCAIEFN